MGSCVSSLDAAKIHFVLKKEAEEGPPGSEISASDHAKNWLLSHAREGTMSPIW